MGYIDFHNHTLFGVDHGVQKRETYLKLLSEYKKHGFSTIVFTPHLFHPTVTTKIGNIRENFLLASEDAAKMGIRTILGCELYVGSQLEIKCLPIAGRYALCEFPIDRKPIGLDRKLKQLTDQNLEIIIAHVERYRWVTPENENFRMFADMGAYIQVNAESVENQKALPYLEKGLVDIIASDNHGDITLPGRLARCLEENPDVLLRMQSMLL